MANLFGFHLPLTGYGPQYHVGDTVPGAQSWIQQYQAGQRPGLGGMGAPGGMGGFNPANAGAVINRLGYGGLAGVSGAYDSMPTPGGAPQPAANPAGAPSGWGGMLGGVGQFVDQHRGALSDLGKVAGGALNAYGMFSQVQQEKKAERRAQDESDRKRRDQEAAAQAVAPAYAELLRRLGYPTGG